MKWSRADKWFEESNCGRYRVTAYKINGKFKFQAIRKPATSLLVADSADKCKQACLEDSK